MMMASAWEIVAEPLLLKRACAKLQRRAACSLSHQDPKLFWKLTSELKKHTPTGAAREEVARRCVVRRPH